MSDNNENGLRGFEDNQPDVFNMDDTSEDLISYDGFMSPDYSPAVEEKAEQQTIDPPAPEQINYDEEPANPSDKQAGENLDNQAADPDKINYDDEVAPAKTDEFKEEEALEKLKALGYDVSKKGEVDPLQTKQFEITELERVNNSLKEFVQQDDLSLCREHVIEETITKWRKEGREPDLKSEEFKTEVEYEMVQFEDNPRLAGLQAGQVKQILNQAIAKNETKKTEISNEVKATRDKELRQNRESLQGVFNGYNGKTMFGVQITPEHLKSAYKSITSGELSKQVNGDQSLQAEFALFLGMREQLGNSGSGTYNEGVAAAIKALEGSGPKVESSLAQTVSRNGAGTVLDRATAWKDAQKVVKTEK